MCAVERTVSEKEVEGEERQKSQGKKIDSVELEQQKMEWVLILNLCQHLNLLFCYQFFIRH